MFWVLKSGSRRQYTKVTQEAIASFASANKMLNGCCSSSSLIRTGRHFCIKRRENNKTDDVFTSLDLTWQEFYSTLTLPLLHKKKLWAVANRLSRQSKNLICWFPLSKHFLWACSLWSVRFLTSLNWTKAGGCVLAVCSCVCTYKKADGQKKKRNRRTIKKRPKHNNRHRFTCY